ncbi:MAG: acetyl-CoA carboxylase biotin carboxyl carrier protein [Elusimicrobiota bacterium]
MPKKTGPKSGVRASMIERGGTSRAGALDEIKSLYDFMVKNNLESLELEDSRRRIKLARRKAQAPAPIPVPVPVLSLPPAMQQGAQPPALPAGAIPVKAGMMGIFYRASSPSSPPYVKEGDHVPAGQVIGMIEAMKVFNEIKADFDCTLLKALIENGKPVKLGQDIFLVRRD